MKETFIELLIDMNIIKSEDDISSIIANFYLNSALDFVKYYVSKQDYDDADYAENFETSILNIAIYMYRCGKDANFNIASKTQGSRSISYRGYDIPATYYQNLPRYPKLWGDTNMSNGNKCCKNREEICGCFFGSGV